MEAGRIGANMNKAVFIDRDGTLIKDKDYLAKPSEVELIENTIPALEIFEDLDYRIFIITNQSGVARGYFSEKSVKEVNDYLKSLLSEHGISIAKIYYCPHHPDGEVEKYSYRCNCRKPEPGMLHKAREEFNINLEKSATIGDKKSDVLVGQVTGGKGILVLTGHGEKQKKDLNNRQPDHISNNLFQAALWLQNG